MTTAIENFKNLVVFDRNDYADFEPSPAGEPYHDALHDFCAGHEDLTIAELGIEFTVLDVTKANMQNCESKMEYDLEVSFRDAASGKLFVLSTAVYKATDRYYGGMVLSEVEESAKPKSEAQPAAKVLTDSQAQDLVQKFGACFSVQGRELAVDDVLDDIRYSPYVGSILDFEDFSFRVTDEREEVTDESDAWALGEGMVELTEVSQGFKVLITTDLFIGQDTEIRGVTITCGNASFELSAHD